MNSKELSDALDGLFAYDTGCVSSGIRDERLRERVKCELRKRPEKWLDRWVRDCFLSEEALKQGYGLEDVRQFFDWLSERMDYDI